MTNERAAVVAEGLTEAQKRWVLSMPDGEKKLSPEEWEAVPELYVQFSPDEYCTETGCYLGGGQRHWFAGSSAHYRGDGGPWHFTAQLNNIGLAIRDHLRSKKQ